MSFNKAQQKVLNKTALEATGRVMSFELAGRRLSKGLGAKQALVAYTGVLDLMGGQEIVVYLLKRYKYQIWVAYTAVVTIVAIAAIL